MIFILYLAVIRPCLEYLAKFWASQFKKESANLSNFRELPKWWRCRNKLSPWRTVKEVEYCLNYQEKKRLMEGIINVQIAKVLSSKRQSRFIICWSRTQGWSSWVKTTRQEGFRIGTSRLYETAWNRLLCDVLNSLPLEIFKQRLDFSQSEMF